MSGPQWTQIFSDQPITTEAGLAFQFEGLARTLAELAWSPGNQTPFTVVVRGDWGRGKTTLMRQTKRLFEEAQAQDARKVRSVWFNAWKCPSEDTVLAGLLGALVDALRVGEMDAQGKLLVMSLKQMLAGMALKFEKHGVQVDLSSLSGADRKRAFYDTFRQLFAQVLYLWQSGRGAVVQNLSGRDVEAALERKSSTHVLAVFLDDLDRCNEARVLEVLEAINLFLDLPGVCFYLGLDWGRLTALLNKTMGGREEEFLEKIVQISLDLPQISDPGIEEYLNTLIEGTPLQAVLEGDKQVGLQVLAKALASNHPRHVKRFLNDLSMTLGILRNTDKLDQPGADAQTRLQAREVVAWHLLHEVLPPEEWAPVRALRSGLDALIDRCKNRDQWQDADAAEVASPALLELHKEGKLDGPVGVLARLNAEQRDLLVHFGSPPKELSARPVSGHLDDEALVQGDRTVWVDIPAGKFTMGDADIDRASPPREVALSRFRISRYPITNAQYARFVSATGITAPKHFVAGSWPEGKAMHPVVNVSWSDAVAFCTWLSREVNRAGEPAVRIVLPSEAQWEYVARWNNGRAYPWRDTAPNENRANFGEHVGDTTPVDRYRDGATELGVYDMAGNVWEWCGDWYGDYADAPGPDPKGPPEGNLRVLRGGAFDYNALYLRAAYRYDHLPGGRFNDVGFRVVWRLPRGQT